MKEFYFVIGYQSVEKITKVELLERIEEEYYGPDAYFYDEIDERDPSYWGEEGYLIIKGNIVTPEAEEKITKYDID